MAQFSANSAAASKIVEAKAAGYNILGNPRPAVMEYVAHHHISEGTYPSLAVLIQDIEKQVKQFEWLQAVARRLHEIYPDLAQGRRRNRARPRYDGRLEAHRHHGRRENR